MKKRIISFILILSMVSGLFVTFGTNVTANGVNHKSGSDDLCNMLTYAYNAMQYSSPKYYIAHHNINNVYNADSLKENFDDSPTTAIVNSLKDSSGWEKFSTIVLEVLTTIFEFDGELTQQDLYDTLLISMLLEGAVKEANDIDAADEVQSFISDIFSLTITVNDVAMPLFEYLKANKDPAHIIKSIKEAIKKASVDDLSDVFTISANGDTISFSGGLFYRLISWASNKKISVENCAKFSKNIDKVFDILEYGFMALDELDELCTILAKSFIIWKYVDESALVLLEKMRTYTNDTFLKTAISKYIRLIEDDSISGFINCVIDNICETTTELNLNALCMLFKSKVLSKSAIYTTATLTFTAFDLAGHLSDKAEMIYVVRCLNTVNQAVILSIQDIEDICVAGYDKETSVPYCDGYVSGMLMAYRLLATELDYATEYLNTWYGTEKFNAYFGNNAAWDQWKTSIAHARNLYETLKPSNFMDKALNRYNGHKDVINKGLTVIYDLNGGEGSIPSQVKPYDGSIFLSDTIPTKQGSTFLGWSVKGVLYQSGEELGLYLKELGTTLRPCWCSDELVITAQWEPNGTPDPDPDPKPDPDPTPDPDPDPDPDPTPESYTLSGIIRNATEGSADYGKAVEGVTVTRKASDGTVIDSAVTDATGTFSFTFTGEKGDYIFMFSKTGFQTKETAAMTIHQTSPSLGAFVIYEEEIVDEGTCGTNLTWTLDSDGTLTISGEGAMTDYNGDVAPWDAKRAQIKNVLIGNGITRIGDYAFYECTRLTEISIPDSVTNIGDSAFYHCSRLTQISIPDSVTSIGSYAFCDCSSLTQISIPDSVTGIKGYTFYDCSSLTQISIPDSVTIIGNSAFSYCSSLTKISIPDSVISIGDSAFYHCSSLTEISMSNSVSSIGEYAFSYCSSLAQISIPNSVISIRSYVFSNCSSLTEVSIPNSISSIGEYAFSYCSSLTEVSIPDSVSSIGGYAFSYCSSLAQISIPNSVTNLGYYTFYKCSSLTEISIPDSVTYLGYATFSYCYSLTKISIPDSVIHIEDYTFYDCSSLTQISIPDSVTSIGNIAFAHCSSLTEISIPDSVTSIGFSAFLYCSSLTEISIPDSVISIGYAAFSDCSRLTKISIPGSITSIEYSTFRNCSSLTEISIPDSVTNIGDHAFYSCTNLTSIYFYGDTPIVGSDAFSNTASNLTLYYIHGKSGWTSPTWNGYNTATFTPDSVDPEPTVPGDLTGDGVLDYFDISALYSAYQSGEVDPATMDVNNDGVVDYYDVAKLYAAFRGTISLGN